MKTAEAFKEWIKLHNLEEHLRVVRAEVQRESSALADARAQREEIESGLATREQALSVKEKTLDEIASKLNEANSLIQTRSASLDEREANLENGINMFMSEVDKRLAEINSKREETTAYIEAETNALDKKRKEYEAEFSKNDSDIDDKKRELNAILEQIAIFNKEQSKAQYERDVATTAMVNARKEKEAVVAELNELKLQNVLEGQKIKDAHAGLEARELTLKNRESNYLTLKGRLTKVFEKLYPEQNIDNILK